MPLPKRLKIRGLWWKISYTKRRPKWAKVEAGGGEQVGCCDTSEQKIWVKNTGNLGYDLRKLCHEVDHAIHPEACERVIVEGEDGLHSLLCDNDLSWAKGDA